MMRGTRGLLLLAILAILGTVAATYYSQRETLARQAPAAPRKLPAEVDAAASDWVWAHRVAGRPVVEIRAKNFRQVKDKIQLEGVDFRIFHEDGHEFDHVTSARAEFDAATSRLYSDGEVEITMGMRADEKPAGRLVHIKTSGATFDSKTGNASTERAASFVFDRGTGQCTGAAYDPNSRELHMNRNVELHWAGSGPKSKPMKLEAGELIYKERDSVVLLYPWSRLTRDTTTLEGADAIVTLQDGAIQKVEAKDARGKDTDPKRQVEYAADHLVMQFNPDGEVENILGEPNARLVSVSDTARNTMKTDRVDLEFDVSTGESALKQARAIGHSSMESVPVPRPGAPQQMTRVLTSEVILVHMRPGGKEIDRVETHTPGHLEFLPNRPEQRRRVMDGERMTFTYGPKNQVESFRSVNVSTRTDPAPRKRPPATGQPAPPAPPVETWSRDFKADFDPKTGELARIQQWGDFRYREGDRRATADSGELDESQDRITLQKDARAADASGSTSADRILLDQKSGDVSATGNVISTRLPDRKGPSSAMLSQDEPLQATAERMSTTGRNRRVVYEGRAVVWQGPNRIQADRVEIDRAAQVLVADGHVRTQLVDTPKDAKGQPKAGAAPVFVTVEAPRLVYTGQDRLAHYTGGTHLNRPGMDVRSDELRAFLTEGKSGSSLDRAFADGKVVIVQTAPDRTRRFTSEHAEYYVADNRTVLNGGQPAVEDSARGTTRGTELIYYANDDKLVVNGAKGQPAVSRLRQKPQAAARARIN